MNKPNAATIKPFKSALAAKMAMTKAERAMDEASRAETVARHEHYRVGGDGAQAAHEAAKATYLAAHAHARAVCDQAQAQGFWVNSCFNYDATRELILNNMD